MDIYFTVRQKQRGEEQMKTIEIDGGMFGMKATCGGEKFYVRSLVAPIENVATDNGYKVEYCKKEYMVGEESIPVNYDYDKKRIENKIATYLAIAHFIEYDCEKVNVVIGMPLEHWLDRDRRAAFEAYFKSAIIQLKVTKGGVERNVRFAIENIKAYPETIGHLYIRENQKKFHNRTVAILDCGGANFQGAVYRNMVPIKESCFTSNKGANFYIDEIKRAINNKFGTNYQTYQIDDLIKYGANNHKREAIKDEIKRVTKNYLLQVLSEARARNWELNDLPLIATGGGIGYFEETIQELLPNTTISDNKIWDNVNGFAVIGGIVFGKEKTA